MVKQVILKRASYFSVALILLLTAMPVGPIIENAYAEATTTEVGSCDELAAALADDSKTIKLTTDLTGCATASATKEKTIDGAGHKMSFVGDGINIKTNEAIMLSDIVIESTKVGIQIPSGSNATSTNLTLNNVTVRAGERGISYLEGQNGASLSVAGSTIENSKIADYDSDWQTGYSRGINLVKFTNSTANVTNSTIQGFQYDVNMTMYDMTGATFNFNGGILKGWTGFNMWQTGATINVSNTQIYGINKFNTNTNSFSDSIFNQDANNNNITFTNVGFHSVYKGAALGENGQSQWMFSDYGYNNNTIFNNCEFDQGLEGRIDYAITEYGNANITINSGTYDLPMEEGYLAQGKVNYLVNGRYVVDDAPNLGAVPARMIVKAGEATTISGLENAGSYAKYEAHRGDAQMSGNPTFVAPGVITTPSAGYAAANVTFDIYKYNDAGEIVRDNSYNKKVLIHSYEADEADAMYLAIGDSDAISLNFTPDNKSTGEVYVADDTVATITDNGDGTYKVSAVGLGNTKIYGKVVTKDDATVVKDLIELGTVKVYSFVATDEVTIPVGTTVNLQDGVIAQIGNPSAVTVELSGDAATLSGTTTAAATAEGTLTAVNAGDTTLTFKAGGEVLGTTKVKVYDLQNPKDLVLSLNRVGANLSERVEFNDLNLPAYDIMIDDISVARVGTMRFGFCNTILAGNNQNCIGAWGAGDAVATVIYHDSLDGATTEQFNIKVSEYYTRDVNGDHDVAQGGEVKFMIAEKYDQNSVSYEDDLGFGIVNDADGEYTVSIPEDIAAGEYTLKFKDVVGGKTIATQDVRIRVHEIVTSEDELFVKKDGEAAVITAKEKNDYGNICRYINLPFIGQVFLGCNIRVNDASGATSNGVSVNQKGNDEFEIKVNAAGEYTVTFSDGVAEKSITVYGIDFEVNDLEYHVNSTDTSEKLINAINHYWSEHGGSTTVGGVTHSDGHVSSRFRVTSATDGSVQEGDGYNFRIRHSALADHYTLELSALIGGNEVDSKTVDIYVYRLSHPRRNVYYDEITDGGVATFEGIVVGDELNSITSGMAVISAEVTDGVADAVDLSEISDGKVLITEPGQYEVTYIDTMNRGNGDVADTWTATFNVYGLSADVQDDVLDLNEDEKYEYTIDKSQTYGLVRTTITRRGPTGSPAREVYRSETRYNGTETETEHLTFDPAQYGEGKYTIRVENVSARRHGLSPIVYEATFYVIAVEHDFVIAPQGREVVVESGSRWSVDDVDEYFTGDTNLAINGKTVTLDTTELPLGPTWVNITHDLGDGQSETLKFVEIIIYKVTPDEKTDPEQITKDTIESLIDAIANSELSGDALDKIKETFGDEWNDTLMNLGLAMVMGQEIETRVSVTDLDESVVSEDMVKTIAALGADHVDYYDVSVLMEMNGVELGKLHKLNDKITVALAKVSDPASGYSRQYFIIREHNGMITVLEEGVDFYIEDGVIYVISDEFSTYAVAYKDTLLPRDIELVKSPDTGKNTAKGFVKGAVTNNNIVIAITIIFAILAILANFAIAGASIKNKA